MLHHLASYLSSLVGRECEESECEESENEESESESEFGPLTKRPGSTSSEGHASSFIL